MGTVDAAFFFDPGLLHEVARCHREAFRTARPFPHAVIDGLLPEAVLDEVLGEFPAPQGRSDWIRFDRATSVKLAMPHDWALGAATRHLLNQLNSAVFVNFLEALTGIEALIPDPHYEGGGLHQIEPGGYLKVHADFNRYERLRLDRRLNALLYLNREWQDEWGGHLELWDRSMAACSRRIAPVFNRLVVFATTDRSYHGHPDALRCPPGTTRRSLALYYYTNGRPEEERSAGHSTLYRARPGETLRHRLRWKDFIPPVAGRITIRLSNAASRRRRSGRGNEGINNL
jgi:Rps23 Pro-64 3,4-dihydroxylase Tpa1-like proline 4-hydroxylase